LEEHVKRYDVGDEVRVRCRYWGDDGQPVDQESVACAVTDPSGTTTQYDATSTPAVTHPSTGAYHLLVVVDQPGEWVASWGSVGPVRQVARTKFLVEV
jgi:hypothetical protein